MEKMVSKNTKNLILVIVGSFIFCLGVSLFITPLNLYNGGILGVSEIIRTILEKIGITFPFEISGILNMLFNIPLLLIARKVVSRKFFALTTVAIIAQTGFFTILPKFDPIIKDTLTSVIVGGLVAGVGLGITLKSNGSSGGVDIIGVCASKNHPGVSVGKMSIAFNAIVYAVCGILFSLETAIYSILYVLVYTLIVDRFHYQNIQMSATIITKNKDIVNFITNDMRRGVTFWKGYGGYTDSETYVMITALSKDEISLFKAKVKEMDKNSFIIMSDNLSISGNFEKRL